MLYDRPYMRDPLRGGPTAVVVTIGALLGIFILQMVALTFFGAGEFIRDWFWLSLDSLQRGRVWTVLTYGLMHGGLWHVGLNCLVLFFFGRAVEPVIGSKPFLFLLGACVLGGAIAFILVQTGLSLAEGTLSPTSVVGASAGVVGVVIYFCTLSPNQPITLLLFFVLPITIKPKYIAYFVAGMDLFGLVFREIGAAGAGGISHSAHLGGALSGFLACRMMMSDRFANQFGSPAGVGLKFSKPDWLKPGKRARAKGKQGRKVAAPGKIKVNITQRDELKSEVDRILDKINSRGFGSLSEEEKDTLDRARDLLNR